MEILEQGASRIVSVFTIRLNQQTPGGAIIPLVHTFMRPDGDCPIGAGLKADPRVFPIGQDYVAGLVPAAVCAVCRLCRFDHGAVRQNLMGGHEVAVGENGERGREQG